MIVVDYESLGSPIALRHTKNLIIEHLVKHPESIVVVSNAIQGSDIATTSVCLHAMQFACDGIICNPLAEDIPEVTFKVMLAAKFQADEAQNIILAVDQDPDVLGMWKDSGVPHIYRPLLEEATNDTAN